MQAALGAVGVRFMYLLPYSPDFSPIENFWSRVKTIKKIIGARIYQALKKAIDLAYGQVSQKDIEHWLAFCCYCTSLN